MIMPNIKWDVRMIILSIMTSIIIVDYIKSVPYLYIVISVMYVPYNTSWTCGIFRIIKILYST